MTYHNWMTSKDILYPLFSFVLVSDRALHEHHECWLVGIIPYKSMYMYNYEQGCTCTCRDGCAKNRATKGVGLTVCRQDGIQFVLSYTPMLHVYSNTNQYIIAKLLMQPFTSSEGFHTWLYSLQVCDGTNVECTQLPSVGKGHTIFVSESHQEWDLVVVHMLHYTLNTYSEKVSQIQK